MAALSRAVVPRPDSVTHWTCPSGIERTGDPNTVHHILASGKCRWCGVSATVLRIEQAKL